MKNRVSECRRLRGLTQEQLGTALDVSRQTIYAIEAEKFDASLPLAIRTARYFGMTVEELFTLDP